MAYSTILNPLTDPTSQSYGAAHLLSKRGPQYSASLPGLHASTPPPSLLFLLEASSGTPTSPGGPSLERKLASLSLATSASSCRLRPPLLCTYKLLREIVYRTLLSLPPLPISPGAAALWFGHLHPASGGPKPPVTSGDHAQALQSRTSHSPRAGLFPVSAVRRAPRLAAAPGRESVAPSALLPS